MTEPLRRLKRAVMEAIGSGTSPSTQLPWFQRISLRAAGSAALVAVVVITGVALISVDHASPSDVLAASDALAMALDGDGIAGRFTFSEKKGLGVFESNRLPPIAVDTVYQLWLIDGAGVPSSAGLFSPDAGGSATVLVQGVRRGLLLGLTVEPAGGSAQPTGPVLLTATIG